MAKKPLPPDEVVQAQEVDVDAFASTPANRARAHKLRLQMRANGMLAEADATWLADYEEQRARVQLDQRNRGASRARKVSYTEEEQEAAGEGSAADSAASAAAMGTMVREEGRRYDSLIGVGITALRTAVDVYGKMCAHMMQRNHDLERAHIDMMEAYREHFLGRVEAEAELEVVRRQAEEGDKDGLSKLAEQLLPFIAPQLLGAGPEGDGKK
jgi:hypothetical protein